MAQHEDGGVAAAAGAVLSRGELRDLRRVVDAVLPVDALGRVECLGVLDRALARVSPGGVAVRGAGDRLADALRTLARWSIYAHDGDPRHLTVRRDDKAGDTLLRTSEGAVDQVAAREFAWAVTECVEAFRAPGSSVGLGVEDLWRLYDLVSARVAQYDASELVAMENLGGEPWRLLQRRLRMVLPAPESMPAS